MVTRNSISSNIPIEIAKGGSNAISLTTTNGSLVFDATKLVTTSTGNYGNSLKSNGAALPTFLPVSGMTLISTKTANNSASIAFTDLVTNGTYLILMSAVIPATNAVDFLLTYSNDNGGTYASSGYNFRLSSYIYNSNSLNNFLSTANAIIGKRLSNANTFSGYVNLGYTGNTKTTGVQGQAVWQDTTLGTVFAFLGNYIGNGVNGLNAIKLAMSSGNISTGTFSLYGVAT